jgi:hypothetical protein
MSAAGKSGIFARSGGAGYRQAAAACELNAFDGFSWLDMTSRPSCPSPRRASNSPAMGVAQASTPSQTIPHATCRHFLRPLGFVLTGACSGRSARLHLCDKLQFGMGEVPSLQRPPLISNACEHGAAIEGVSLSDQKMHATPTSLPPSAFGAKCHHLVLRHSHSPTWPCRLILEGRLPHGCLLG